MIEISPLEAFHDFKRNLASPPSKRCSRLSRRKLPRGGKKKKKKREREKKKNRVHFPSRVRVRFSSLGNRRERRRIGPKYLCHRRRGYESVVFRLTSAATRQKGRRKRRKAMEGGEKREKWPSRLTGNTIGRKQSKFGIINLTFRSGSFHLHATRDDRGFLNII